MTVYVKAKESIKGKIEEFLYLRLSKDEYEVSEVNPNDLLSVDRFDIGFKLIFLRYYKKCERYALQVYEEDIKAQTLGSFKEYGNDSKDHFEKYVSDFLNLHSEIERGGFDHGQTIIPLSKANTILNGAHRLASAVVANRSVACVYTELEPLVCNYRYFKNRDVPDWILDAVANELVRSLDDTYLAFIWPSTKGQLGSSSDFFPDIFYEKDVSLTMTGAFNLIYQLYKHMDWIGSREDGYKGARVKVVECFPVLSSVKVIAFRASNLLEVRSIKAKVRSQFNIEYSSIHITDTKEEAVRASNLVFNDNGRHFLNYGNPYNTEKSLSLIEDFREYLEGKCSLDDVVIDGSAVLSLYGLRECADIDFVSSQDLVGVDNKFDSHEDFICFHGQRKESLIFDPRYHFVYEGIKFVSFDQVFRMKSSRNEIKDKIDVQLMSSMLSKTNLRTRISTAFNRLMYLRIRVVQKMFIPLKWLLRKLGIFERVKRLYDGIFR